MTSTDRSRKAAIIAFVSSIAFVLTSSSAVAEPDDPLRVFTTVPDLAALAKRVGGVHVEVFSMVEGREDAHFAEPKPSFIKRLAAADVYIEVGLELEAGYAPALLKNARNGAVIVGAPGHVTAGAAVPNLPGTARRSPRARGDVHGGGDPHFLVDPLAGIAVAGRIRERLSMVAPAHAEDFSHGYETLRKEISARLVGEALAGKHDVDELAILYEQGRLDDFLHAQGDTGKLGGWLARMAPYRGAKVVDDHAMWAYFARRFGLEIVGHLEPFPGIPPTTKHLTALVERMRAEHVAVIIASPYYDVRHAEKVAAATGATVARLTHQTGGMPNTDDYVAMVDYNVRTIVEACERARNGIAP